MAPPRRKKSKLGLLGNASVQRKLTHFGAPSATTTCTALLLPPEILLSIISYFDAVPIEKTKPLPQYDHVDPCLGPSALERIDVTRALSQTCRAWRSFFWHVLWENVEISALRDHKPEHWERNMAGELLRRSQGISSNPDIANTVRKMRVVLLDEEKVLSPFAQCLSVCSNLHTLHIASAPVHRFRGPFERALTASDRRYLQFPSIQTIILPPIAHCLLRCCPNAQKVVCLGNFDYGKQVITAIRVACPKVEVLTGVQLEGPNEKKMRMSKEERGIDAVSTMKRLVKAAPKLRELSFGSPVSDAQLPVLSGLKHLRLLELTTLNPDKEKIKEHMESTFRILNDELGWSICVPTSDTVDSMVVADSEARKCTLVISYKPKVLHWWEGRKSDDPEPGQPWTRMFTFYSTKAVQQPETRPKRSRKCKERSV